MANDGESVTIGGHPLYASVLPQELRFPPPFAHLAKAAAGFSHWWQLIGYAYDPPPPSAFPPLDGITSGQARVLQRYLHTCEELAQSTVLSHDGGVRFTFTKGESQPKIIEDFPPTEALRGTTVLFRQLASNDEPASFNAARKIIGHRIHEQRDAHHDQRDEMQRRWRKTHVGLRMGLLRTEVEVKYARSINWQNPVGGEDVRPEYLLAIFQYGDLIHWQDHAATLEALASNHFDFATARSHFIEVVIQLSHFYLGYALLVRAAMGLPPPLPA